MEAIFEKFIIGLSNDVPSYIYQILLSLAFTTTFFFIFFKWEKALRYSLGFLFFEYLFLIYCSTVFFRSKVKDIWYNFTPFWSYKAYYDGKAPSLLPEIIMNVIVFIPLGFLMAAGFRKLRWRQVILTGLLISLSIESLQFCFKLGIAEFDDVFNNTLGVALGYSLYVITNFTINKLRKFPK